MITLGVAAVVVLVCTAVLEARLRPMVVLAAQAQAQTQQSYSAPRQSYTPSYSAPQQSYTPSYSGGGSGSSVPDFVPSSGGYGVEPDGSWHPGNIIQH